MNRIEIGPGQEFSLGGENFVITVPVKERRLSTSDAFTIAKNEPYIRVYEELASAFSPRSILELGISREGATCSWTSCSNLAEFLPLRSVQSLSRRFYDMLPIRRVGSFTFPLRSLIAKFLSISFRMNLRMNSIWLSMMHPTLMSKQRHLLRFFFHC